MRQSMLVFLDFDGVLHHFFPLSSSGDEENQLFYYLPKFEEVARQHDFDIVISSTWRVKKNLEDIKAIFSPDIAERIVGVTPFLDGSHSPGGREKEVLAYLEKTGQMGRPWVGVDDFPSLYSKGPCVQCFDKFDQDEANRLAEALQDPLAYAQKYPIAEKADKTIFSL